MLEKSYDTIVDELRLDIQQVIEKYALFFPGVVVDRCIAALYKFYKKQNLPIDALEQMIMLSLAYNTRGDKDESKS
jgi:hypothetical protein